MRRKDLELSVEETYEIVDANKYAVVSLVDAEGFPYGVALDYIHRGVVPEKFGGDMFPCKFAAIESRTTGE